MQDEGCQECEYQKSAARELEDDNHHLQGRVSRLECQLEEKEIECDQLTANLAELSEYVQELETALAEAHLMSHNEEAKKT